MSDLLPEQDDIDEQIKKEEEETKALKRKKLQIIRDKKQALEKEILIEQKVEQVKEDGQVKEDAQMKEDAQKKHRILMETSFDDVSAQEPIEYFVRAHTPFIKMFEAYAKRHDIHVRVFRFLYNGRQIDDSDTPEKLNMKLEEHIDVVKIQTGG